MFNRQCSVYNVYFINTQYFAERIVVQTLSTKRNYLRNVKIKIIVVIVYAEKNLITGYRGANGLF